MILELCLVAIICLLCYHFITRAPIYRLGWKLNGPRALPFIGNVHQIMFKNQKELLELLLFYGDKYDHPSRFWIGTNLYVLTANPDEVQTVLNAPQSLNRDIDSYKYVIPLMGNGLVTLPAEKWKEHRRLINPTFNRQVLKSYIPIFNQETNTLAKLIGNEIGRGAFDVYNYIDRCTLDTICQTTMGTEMHVQKNQNVNYLEAANNLLAISPKRMTNMLMRSDFLYSFSKLSKLEEKSTAITHGFVDKILKHRKSTINFEDTETVPENVDYKTPQPFLDQLLKLSSGGVKFFTDEEVKEESNTMVATGFESTALISSYCLLMLAMNPDIQEAVYQEIMTVCPGKNQDVTDDDYQHFKYLERVIKETMRLFPTVPTIARVATEPFQMGDYHIPKDTRLMIGIMSMHRSEKQWGPTAMVFDPDRFLPDRMAEIHNYAYVPFSGGKRDCVGLRYAMMFLKTILLKIVREYKVTTDLKMDELEYSVHISLKLLNKHMIKVERRTSDN